MNMSFCVAIGWDLPFQMISATVRSGSPVRQWLLGSRRCRLRCVEVRSIEIVFAGDAD